jgi:cell division protein FtsW
MGSQSLITKKRKTNQPSSGLIQAGSRKLRQLDLHVDLAFIVIVVFLIMIGLMMVYSASWNYALRRGESTSFVLSRQITWVVLGASLALIASRIDYHLLQRLGLPLMGATLLLLTAVLVLGETRFGSTRTLLNGSIQPSELAKLATIIYISVWLYSKRENLNNVWFGLVPLALILGLTSALLFVQPDLSATATIIMLGGLLFFLAGGDLRQIVLVIVVTAFFGGIIFTMNATGQQRIDSYIQGLQQPEQASYHIKRSLEAIVRGGKFGVGIGEGQSKFTGLPVSWTDSIFAVIVEETGLVGAAVVVTFYLLFLWRGLRIAQNAPDQLGMLLAGGITIWIVMEAVINMGVMVNLLPFAGNALPLMSAGGSSMVTTLSGIGIILSVSHYSSAKKANNERRIYGAVVDLRRRNGGGRVSRSRRSSGSSK